MTAQADRADTSHRAKRPRFLRRNPRGTRPRAAMITASVLILLLGSTGTASYTATAFAEPQGLVVKTETSKSFAGTFSRSSTTIHFSAELLTEHAATANLGIGERTFDVHRDTSSGTGRWSGHGAVLYPDDRDALLEYSTALQRTRSEPLQRVGQGSRSISIFCCDSQCWSPKHRSAHG